MAQILPVSSLEANALKGEFLGLNLGPNSSKFLFNPAPAPKIIHDHEGTSLSDLFAGIGLRYSSVEQQFSEAVEAIDWVINLIENQNYDPFEDQLPLERAGRKLRKNLNVSQEAMHASADHTREHAEFYLVNGSYLVGTMYSTLPHAVRNIYDFADHGTVNFAVVYNRAFPGKNQTTYKKMFIGANTLADADRPSLSKVILANRAEAHRLYNFYGRAFVPSKLNLDVVLAVMMAADLSFTPPQILLDYVESVTLGSFESRSRVTLPSLEGLAPKLQSLETAPGTWGGHPAGATLGSPKDLDTSVTSIEIILENMAQAFPVQPGQTSGYVKIS